LVCARPRFKVHRLNQLTLTEQRLRQLGSSAEPCRPRPPLPRGSSASRHIPQGRRYLRDPSRGGDLVHSSQFQVQSFPP
jgi:hypothetical protein